MFSLFASGPCHHMLLTVYSDVCKDYELPLEWLFNHRLRALENKDTDFLAEDCRINSRLCKNLSDFEV